jgi:predicted dehydrogenase
LQAALPEIGTIRQYFSCFCQYSSRYDKLKEGVALNAFLPELSNGAVMDIGVYTLYPMVVLFGRPRTIQASVIKLHTGVDGHGCVNFTYDNGLNATVLYSKIVNSRLPTEIQGENGQLTLNRIHIINQVTLAYRDGRVKDLHTRTEKNEYYYEMAEFIDLIQDGRSESTVNSLENSLITAEITEEIRRQAGVVFPADSPECM